MQKRLASKNNAIESVFCESTVVDPMEGIERRTLPREPNHQVAEGVPFVHSHGSLWFGTELV